MMNSDVLAAVLSVISGLILLLIAQALQIWQSRHDAKIASKLHTVERQLSELYGPLLGLLASSKSAAPSGTPSLRLR